MGNIISHSIDATIDPSIAAFFELYKDIQLPNLIHNLKQVCVTQGAHRYAAVLRIFSLYRHPILELVTPSNLKLLVEGASPLLDNVTGVFQSQAYDTFAWSEAPAYATQKLADLFGVDKQSFAPYVRGVCLAMLIGLFMGLNKIPGMSYVNGCIKDFAAYQRNYSVITGDKKPLLDTVLRAVGRLLDLQMLPTDAQAQALVNEAIALDANITSWLADFQTNPSHLATSNEFLDGCKARVLALEQTQAALHKQNIDLKNASLVFQRLYANIDKMRSLTVDFAISNSLKVEPVVIWLFGDAGCGKSWIAQHQLLDEMSAADKNPIRSMVRNDNKYWEMYFGQEAVIFDDFFQTQRPETLEEYFEIITCSAFNPQIAACERKRTMFTSPYVIICANWSMFNAVEHKLQSVEAANRRRNFLIRVVNKDVTTKRISTKETPQQARDAADQEYTRALRNISTMAQKLQASALTAARVRKELRERERADITLDVKCYGKVKDDLSNIEFQPCNPVDGTVGEQRITIKQLAALIVHEKAGHMLDYFSALSKRDKISAEQLDSVRKSTDVIKQTLSEVIKSTSDQADDKPDDNGSHHSDDAIESDHEEDDDDDIDQHAGDDYDERNESAESQFEDETRINHIVVRGGRTNITQFDRERIHIGKYIYSAEGKRCRESKKEAEPFNGNVITTKGTVPVSGYGHGKCSLGYFTYNSKSEIVYFANEACSKYESEQRWDQGTVDCTQPTAHQIAAMIFEDDPGTTFYEFCCGTKIISHALENFGFKCKGSFDKEVDATTVDFSKYKADFYVLNPPFENNNIYSHFERSHVRAYVVGQNRRYRTVENVFWGNYFFFEDLRPDKDAMKCQLYIMGDPKFISQAGKIHQNSILLIGPPGCGKTFMVDEAMNTNPEIKRDIRDLNEFSVFEQARLTCMTDYDNGIRGVYTANTDSFAANMARLTPELRTAFLRRLDIYEFGFRRQFFGLGWKGNKYDTTKPFDDQIYITHNSVEVLRRDLAILISQPSEAVDLVLDTHCPRVMKNCEADVTLDCTNISVKNWQSYYKLCKDYVNYIGVIKIVSMLNNLERDVGEAMFTFNKSSYHIFSSDCIVDVNYGNDVVRFFNTPKGAKCVALVKSNPNMQPTCQLYADCVARRAGVPKCELAAATPGTITMETCSQFFAFLIALGMDITSICLDFQAETKFKSETDSDDEFPEERNGRNKKHPQTYTDYRDQVMNWRSKEQRPRTYHDNDYEDVLPAAQFKQAKKQYVAPRQYMAKGVEHTIDWEEAAERGGPVDFDALPTFNSDSTDQQCLDLMKKTAGNIVHVIHNQTVICYATMLTPTMGITVAHALRNRKQVYVSPVNDPTTLDVIKIETVNEDEDYAYFKINRPGKFQKLTAHIPDTKQDLRNCPVFYLRPGEIGIAYSAVVFAERRIDSTTGAKLSFLCSPTSADTGAFTDPGDCGIPVFACNTKMQRKLIGIHNARYDNTLAFSPIVRCASKLFNSEMKGNVVLAYQRVEQAPTSHICENTTHCKYMGKIPKQSKSTETQFWSTGLKLENPDDLQPSILNSKDPRNKGWVIYEKAVSKYNIDKTNNKIDVNALETAIDYVCTRLNRVFNRRNVVLKKLTTSESLSGTMSYPSSKSIDVSKSSGYPWSTMGSSYQQKSGGIAFDEESKQFKFRENKFGQALKHATYQLDRLIQNGEEPVVIYTASLKDEVLKASKALEGRTRAFCAASTEYVIVYRKYYHAFQCAITENSDLLPPKVGFNPASCQGHQLFIYLSRPGPCASDGDFKDWDGTVPVEFQRACTEVICKCYERFDPDWNERDDLARRLIRKAGAENPCVTHYEDLYQYEGLMPSGHPATTVDNSIINWLYHAYAWILLVRDKPKYNSFQMYNQHTELAVLGDDRVDTSSEEVAPWFNMEACRKIYADFNVEMTPADKKGHEIPVKKLMQCEFLKRTFKKVGKFITMPIGWNSMVKGLLYVRRSQTHHWYEDRHVYKYEETVQNCANALFREAALQGKNFYNDAVTKVVREFKRMNYPLPEILNWQHMFKDVYFAGYGEPFLYEMEIDGLALSPTDEDVKNRGYFTSQVLTVAHKYDTDAFTREEEAFYDDGSSTSRNGRGDPHERRDRRSNATKRHRDCSSSDASGSSTSCRKRRSLRPILLQSLRPLDDIHMVDLTITRNVAVEYTDQAFLTPDEFGILGEDVQHLGWRNRFRCENCRNWVPCRSVAVSSFATEHRTDKRIIYCTSHGVRVCHHRSEDFGGLFEVGHGSEKCYVSLHERQLCSWFGRNICCLCAHAVSNVKHGCHDDTDGNNGEVCTRFCNDPDDSSDNIGSLTGLLAILGIDNPERGQHLAVITWHLRNASFINGDDFCFDRRIGKHRGYCFSIRAADTRLCTVVEQRVLRAVHGLHRRNKSALHSEYDVPEWWSTYRNSGSRRAFPASILTEVGFRVVRVLQRGEHWPGIKRDVVDAPKCPALPSDRNDNIIDRWPTPDRDSSPFVGNIRDEPDNVRSDRRNTGVLSANVCERVSWHPLVDAVTVIDDPRDCPSFQVREVTTISTEYGATLRAHRRRHRLTSLLAEIVSQWVLDNTNPLRANKHQLVRLLLNIHGNGIEFSTSRDWNELIESKAVANLQDKQNSCQDVRACRFLTNGHENVNTLLLIQGLAYRVLTTNTCAVIIDLFNCTYTYFYNPRLMAIASAVLGGLGGLASGISGAIQQSQQNAIEQDKLKFMREQLAQSGQQFNQRLDFERMNAASNRDIQRLQINQQSVRQNAQIAYGTQQSQAARDFASQQRNANIDFLRNAAEQAGVPEWQIMSGRVPNVARQLAGANFNIVPAGGDPYAFDQFIAN